MSSRRTSTTKAASRLRASFVMEQHLGHRTFYENLRACVDTHDDVDARWVEITYQPGADGRGRAGRLGDRTAGALHGRAEARGGCRADLADVRFFNTQVPAVLGGRRVRQQPYVLCTDVTPVQYDGMAQGYGHKPDGSGPIARYKHAVNVRVLQAAKRHVAWSRWVRDSLVHDYEVDPQRIEIIPPGVDTTRWGPGAATMTGPVRVLFVGGDFHRKGGDDLLGAFAALPTGTAELSIVTRTPLASSEHVRVYTDLMPNSDDLLALYRTSDIFVMPSAQETFGIAAVEAAASGLPVIATAVGGLPDIVADGETGFVIDPNRPRQLAERLRVLTGDRSLRQRFGAAGRRRVENDFDARANSRRIVKVLQTAAGGWPAAQELVGGPSSPTTASPPTYPSQPL